MLYLPCVLFVQILYSRSVYCHVRVVAGGLVFGMIGDQKACGLNYKFQLEGNNIKQQMPSSKKKKKRIENLVQQYCPNNYKVKNHITVI